MAVKKAYMPLIQDERRKPMLQIFAQALLLAVHRPAEHRAQATTRRG